jgi:hypothetical protein
VLVCLKNYLRMINPTKSPNLSCLILPDSRPYAVGPLKPSHVQVPWDYLPIRTKVKFTGVKKTLKSRAGTTRNEHTTEIVERERERERETALESLRCACVRASTPQVFGLFRVGEGSHQSVAIPCRVNTRPAQDTK